MSYTVINLDRMSGTEDSSQLLSGKYFVSTTPTAIENGALVVVGDLISGERELHKFTAPAGTEDLGELAIVASPEVVYSYREHYNLDEFINLADDAIRAYYIHQFDGFSLTADGFDGTPDVGKYVILGDSTKPKVVASTTSGDVVIGKIQERFIQGKTSAGAAREFFYVETVKG
jgi:hypothetical protein